MGRDSSPTDRRDVGRPRGAAWRSLQADGIDWEGQVFLVGGETDLAARLILTKQRLALARGGAVVLEVPREWLRPPPELVAENAIRFAITPTGEDSAASGPATTDALILRARDGRGAAAQLVAAVGGRVRPAGARLAGTNDAEGRQPLWSEQVGAAPSVALPPLPEFATGGSGTGPDGDHVSDAAMIPPPVPNRRERSERPERGIGTAGMPDVTYRGNTPDSISDWTARYLDGDDEPHWASANAVVIDDEGIHPLDPDLLPPEEEPAPSRALLWSLRAAILLILLGAATYFARDRLPFEVSLAALDEWRQELPGLQDDGRDDQISRLPAGQSAEVTEPPAPTATATESTETAQQVGDGTGATGSTDAPVPTEPPANPQQTGGETSESTEPVPTEPVAPVVPEDGSTDDPASGDEPPADQTTDTSTDTDTDTSDAAGAGEPSGVLTAPTEIVEAAAPTDTPAPTETPVPTSTPTPEPTETPVPTQTPTPVPTETPVPTQTPTPEPTATATLTPTAEPTATDAATEPVTPTTTLEPTAPRTTSTTTTPASPTATASATPQPTEPTETASPTATTEPTSTTLPTATMEPTSTAVPTETAIATATPSPSPTPTLEPLPPSFDAEATPSQQVVAGPFRYTVEAAARGFAVEGLPELADVGYGEWVVIAMYGENWSDEEQVFDMSDFTLIADGREIALDSGNDWVAELVGYSPAYGHEDAVLFAPDEGHRFVLTFLVPPRTEELTLQAGEQEFALDRSLETSPALTEVGSMPDEPRLQAAKVVEVVNAEQITVEIDGQRQGVRYLGIDVPKEDDCYAAEATVANKALVAGQTVYLERQSTDVDALGNWVRDVWVEEDDGTLTLVADRLVSEGAAVAAISSPNTRFADWLNAAEQSARERNAGLWAACGGFGEEAGTRRDAPVAAVVARPTAAPPRASERIVPF